MTTARISRRLVEALEPGQTVWDTSVRGFGVRRQRRDPVYVLKYRYRQRQRFVTIGQHGAPWTPEDARAEAQRLLGMLANRERPRDPATERDDAKTEPDFAAFAERYLAEYATIRKKPRSVAEDQRNLKLHILPCLGDLKLSEIARADIARFQVLRRHHPANANRCLALISHIMTMAEKWGVRPQGTNPCRGIDRYRELGRERSLSAEELRRLGEALDAAAIGTEHDAANPRAVDAQPMRRTPEDWRAIACIRLLLFTGARLGEILSLRWSWIDMERGVARLSDSKTGRRNLTITTPALQLLAQIPRTPGSPFVLPGNKPGAHFIGIQKPWQRIRERAGLADLRLHDLRHAFASLAVSNGTSLYAVGSMLGHSHPLTTQRYAHLAPDSVRGMADETAGQIAAMLGRAQDAR